MVTNEAVHHINAQPYVLTCCPTCGLLYLIPQAIKDAALRMRDANAKTYRKIYCPDGHEWHYTTLTKDDAGAISRLKELEFEVADLKDKLDAAERLNRQLGVNVVPLPKKA